MDETEHREVETHATGPAPGDGRRRSMGRFGLIVLWISGLVLVIAALAVAALAALVAHGPVEIAAAARTAEALLAEIAGPDGRARVGNARLDWGWDKGLAVELDEIAVDRAGVLLMQVPRAEIRLRLAPILTGDVRPSAMVLIDPRFILDTAGLAAAGTVVASAARPAAAPPAALVAPSDPPAVGPSKPAATRSLTIGPPPTAPSMPAMPAPPPRPQRSIAEAREIGRAIDRAVEAARSQGIESFSVRNGTVELLRSDDRGTVRHVFVPEIDIEAVIDGPGGELDAGFSARGDIGRWSMRLTSERTDSGAHRLSFIADDVTHRDLFGPPGPAFDMGMPLYPRVTFTFGQDSRVDGAEIDLKLGAGEFRFGPLPEDSVLIDEGQALVVWRPDDNRFDVRHLHVGIGDTRLTLHGSATPPSAGRNLWDLHLEAEAGLLRPRDVGGKGVAIDSGVADATFDPTTKVVTIAGATAQLGPQWVKTAGRIDFSGEEPRLRLDLSFSSLDLGDVKRMWPHWVAPDARTWFIHNVEGGRANDLQIRLDMPRFDKPETWPGNAFQMSTKFDGARFRVFGNLPQVVAADGRMTIAERKLEVVLDKAQVATKWPKRPSLEGLRFTIPDIFVKPPKGTVRVQVAGDVPALAEIVNSEPMAVLDEGGIKLDGLAGTATVVSQIDILFEKQINPASVDYKIDATLDRFSSPNPIMGRHFQDGKFKVTADPRGIKVTGRAMIDGVVADFDMYDARGGSKSTDKRDFKMVLDEAARQRVGLDLGDLVHGAIGVSVAQIAGSDTKRRVEVDLTPARLDLTQFGWSKGPGVPAKATLDLTDDDKGVRLDNLSLESEGVTITGSVVLDKDRKLVSADFGKFALHKGDSAKVKVTRGADQVLTIGFDAQNFDGRSLMKASRRSRDDAPPETAAKPADLVLKLKAAKLTGFNDMVLSDVTVDGRYRGNAFTTLQVAGRTPGGRSLSASIKPDGDRRALLVTADDGGMVLSFLDLFDRISGGKLIVAGKLGGPGVAQGVVRLSDFHLLEEPKAGRAAPQKTADGVQQIKVRRVEFNPQTDFSRSSVIYSMRDGVITVTEGVAKGQTVGATASGQVDLNNQRLALTGTYIPAFGLNNLVGRIPVLGAIAGAGSNEGLVGVTFRVFGPVDDPILEINPLSAIAPGIFRKIFEFQKDENAPAPPSGNAPTRITP